MMLADHGLVRALQLEDVSGAGHLPEVSVTGNSIRAFEKRDIPCVCELFSRTFRPGRPYRTEALADCIAATYFASPAYTRDSGSIVHVDETGRVDGFMGVIPITMTLGGRSLRGGILSAYMADDPVRNPTIGVSLVRGVMSRGFDILFTDTANRTSLDIARALRFTVLSSQSLEWVKILRPAGTGLYFLGKRIPWIASRLIPLARAVDGALLQLQASKRPSKRRRDRTTIQAISARDFVEIAHVFVDNFKLKPAWTDRAELAWFVDQASLQTKYGKMQIREVLDRGNRRIGLYLLYARRDGVAYALQILAKPNYEERVVDRLIADAVQQGAVAVRGATTKGIAQGLLRQSGIFYHHVMSSVAWSGDPAIAAVIRSDDLFIGGLAGETWARVVTEDFA